MELHHDQLDSLQFSIQTWKRKYFTTLHLAMIKDTLCSGDEAAKSRPLLTTGQYVNCM
jgi:hypothetical protein